MSTSNVLVPRSRVSTIRSPGFLPAMVSRRLSRLESGYAVGGDEQVAAQRVARAGHRDVGVPGSQARPAGGAAGVDALDEQAVVGAEAEEARHVVRHGHEPDAEERVLDPAGLEELRHDRAYRVAGDREADADVALAAGVPGLRSAS